jgi:dynein regulatory complex protein 1
LVVTVTHLSPFLLYLQELGEQKRVAPMARILRRAGDEHKAFKTSSGSAAAASKAKIKRADKAYWDTVVKILPPRSVRVMTALEKGMTLYHKALLKRKELIDDVTSLKHQNTELKNLLTKYLSAPINEDLLVPPTQMQVYQ